MFPRFANPLARTVSGAALAFALLLPVTEIQASEFNGMAGAWTGTGQISVNNNKEKLRCRANYNVSNAGATVAYTEAYFTAFHRLRPKGDPLASPTAYDPATYLVVPALLLLGATAAAAAPARRALRADPASALRC